jgi:hypothetical protein
MTGPAGRLGGQVAAVGGGVQMRIWWVCAVNTGPPKSLDLAPTRADAIATPPTNVAAVAVRYLASYAVLGPAVGDGVLVLLSLGGGSTRAGGRDQGGLPMVIDKVAV